MKSPVFSIITVVFNGAKLLPLTVESVKAQDWPHVEYLIVDGASTDGTTQQIARYARELPYLRWISEKDRGLYDAMNKGLRMATGDFVWFLNCGDAIYAPDTLSRIAAQLQPDDDVIYGDTLLEDENRQPLGLMSALSTRSLPERLRWRHYLGGMRVVHQSFVARRTLAPPYISDNLCADYDWCIRILKKSRNARNSGMTLSRYLAGGLSKQRHRQSLRDRFKVMRAHFGLPLALLAHGWIALRAAAHRLRRIGKPRY
ncbi:MAG: glycosyltransferase family 2 protein [Saprospiraceae bacterium]